VEGIDDVVMQYTIPLALLFMEFCRRNIIAIESLPLLGEVEANLVDCKKEYYA
jgi:hypothetical protein